MNTAQTLYLEINNTNYVFFVGDNDEQNNFKVIEKLILPLIGLSNNKISDIEKVTDIVNVYKLQYQYDYQIYLYSSIKERNRILYR